MQRRLFLKLCGQSLFWAGSIWMRPTMAWSQTAFDYALQGQTLIQTKQFSQAVAALKKAVTLDPQNDWAYGLLGIAYRELGQKARAVEAFNQAVRINPADIISRTNVERLLQRPIARDTQTRKPLTPLEKAAQQEEVQMLDHLKSNQKLDYQVKRVVIDPGHGGFDSGAVGPSGTKEKDVALDIAIRLYNHLNKEGRIKPFLTRTADYYVPLSARTATANQHKADLFISIHINANERRAARGSETYYCAEKASSAEARRVAAFENIALNYDDSTKTHKTAFVEEILFKFKQKLYWQESGRFANHFQDKFKQQLPLKSRGIHSANFFVLRRAKMPAILLEAGFISNPDNEAMLKQASFRQKIADAIRIGLT
jgi:N-acetylmuramoyl-L-alanine amidase